VRRGEGGEFVGGRKDGSHGWKRMTEDGGN
jgi:hypothetical protein